MSHMVHLERYGVWEYGTLLDPLYTLESHSNLKSKIRTLGRAARAAEETGGAW